MSSNQSSSNGSTNTVSTNSNHKSDSAIVREAGFKSHKQFSESYGLKMYNDEDYQESKAIINAFRQADERAAREKKQRK
jgi:hypothetical protein